ncbi:hypothetical protein BN2537_11955 [Streptomyces venezuelae]|nr:hypothetical protein BN2537_11955 [Streptomyces venezuelae]
MHTACLASETSTATDFGKNDHEAGLLYSMSWCTWACTVREFDLCGPS